MLVRSAPRCYKIPRNMGVAPRFDTWNEKYEAWGHLRRMAKLVGTGFYIPPEWYTHFRMFPPIQHNFTEEKTQNPFNQPEPTQQQFIPDAERQQLRQELAMKSRSLASEGMRYFNLFWVQKPIDQAERRYYRYRKDGLTHQEAIKKVLQDFRDEQTVKKRAQLIQAEEAKLGGKFITMREAATVLKVLAQLQAHPMAPHEYAELASGLRKESTGGQSIQCSVRIKPEGSQNPTDTKESLTPAAVTAPAAADGGTSPPPSLPAPTTQAPPSEVKSSQAPSSSSGEAVYDSPEALAAMLGEGVTLPAGTEVSVKERKSDTVVTLRDAALGAVSRDLQYFGEAPMYTIPSAKPEDAPNPTGKPPGK